MDTIEKQELAVRTRERNVLTRFSLDYGGIMTPLVRMEADLDALAAPSIENYMAISDEAWEIKEDQRDQTVELSQAEVDQDIYLADAKAATGRAKIAIERAVDEYVMAAKTYDAKVKGLIMAAKEYAALVELEQLANEEAKTGLAIDKEALHLIEVKAKIYLQTIEQAQVEADIAKAQVEVAKAHVRAVMADIQAGEAEIKLIEAQTEVFVAEAEKATLQADVANIFAEIMTKQLTPVKYDIAKEEIEHGWPYIQSKLDDALAMYDERGFIEWIRIDAEEAMQTELNLILIVEKAEQDLRLLETEYARLTLIYEETAIWDNIEREEDMRQALANAKMALNTARTAMFIGREEGQTAAAQLVSRAQRSARHKTHYATSDTHAHEHIEGG